MKKQKQFIYNIFRFNQRIKYFRYVCFCNTCILLNAMPNGTSFNFAHFLTDSLRLGYLSKFMGIVPYRTSMDDTHTADDAK